MAAMKVYVLEAGCYSDKWVVGVFSSPEKAMEHWQRCHTTPRASILKPQRSYTWGERDEDEWSFDADSNDAASVYEYEVDKVDGKVLVG